MFCPASRHQYIAKPYDHIYVYVNNDPLNLIDPFGLPLDSP
jgi:hypothetical protein